MKIIKHNNTYEKKYCYEKNKPIKYKYTKMHII